MRWWPLIGVAAVAAALRWFRIDAQSLWYDEGISAHQLTRSFGEILSAAALDTHPPLYYWTLKAWGETFGSSELALRSLSAVWGLCGVVLVWLLGRRLFGVFAATLAALLLAAAPLAVYYSQEVRMYAQVTTLGVLATYGYARRWYWLYAVAAIGALYTQYLGAAMLMALNLHALLWWRSQSRRQWMAWVATNAVAALAFLPWLPTFVAQQSHALNTSPRTPAGLLLDTLTAYGGGIARGDLFLAGGTLLVALGVAGAVLWRPERQAVTLAALLWLAPLALVLALGLRSGLFEVRYLVLSLPGLALLAAAGIVRLAPHAGVAVAFGLAALTPAVLGLMAQYFDPRLARDDYRDLVATIQSEARPSDAIVLSAPNQVEIFAYYYHGVLPTFGLPAQRPIDVADTEVRLNALKARYERIWLVSWAMNEADPQGVITTWLAQHAFQATHQWYGSVQLALVGLGATDPLPQRVDLSLDNGIALESYALASRSLTAGETLALTLVWRADGGPTRDHWKVFTHLLDGDSRVVAQRDAEPADNSRPTTSWQPGEEVQDNYGIEVPENLARGSYTLEIGMYNGEQRASFQGQGDHLVLGQIEVH